VPRPPGYYLCDPVEAARDLQKPLLSVGRFVSGECADALAAATPMRRIVEPSLYILERYIRRHIASPNFPRADHASQ
jgi:hypothetical protein